MNVRCEHGKTAVVAFISLEVREQLLEMDTKVHESVFSHYEAKASKKYQLSASLFISEVLDSFLGCCAESQHLEQTL